MKVNKKCVVGLFAGLMALNALIVPAYADEPASKDKGEVTIQKTIKVPGSYKADLDVSFDIKHDAQDKQNAYPKGTKVPEVTCKSIEFNLDGKQEVNKNNLYIADKSIKVNLNGFTDEFVKDHPGIYVYNVKEGTTKGFDVVDNSVYKLIVMCKNEESGPKVVSFIKENEKKKDSIEFVNEVTDKKSSLVINKKVVGHGYASDDQKFAITIEVMLPGESDYKLVTNATEGIEVEGTYEGGYWQVNDANPVNFTNLPVGTKYMITEPHTENWQGGASVNNPVSGKQSFDKTESDLEIKGVVDFDEEKPENSNSVKITNEHDNIDITGVVLDNAPFIAMIVVPGMFFGASLVNRRKFNL